MSAMTIEVWDATGNKKQVVEVPSDAAVNRLIAVLVDKLNLPRNSPDGQMMSYKFHHRASGRQLLDTETLASASVKDGDILRLQPEITAGSFGVRRVIAALDLPLDLSVVCSIQSGADTPHSKAWQP